MVPLLRAGAVHPGARRRLARLGPGRPDVHRLRERRRRHRARPLPSGAGPRARPSRRARSGTCRTGSRTSRRCGSRSGSSTRTFAERVFFCNSGAEANEAALKLARRYAHDRFGAQKIRVDLDAQRVPRPHAVHGHGRRPGEVRDGLRPESRGHHAHPVQRRRGARAASSPTHGDEICAVILEPMQGEGGMTPGTPAVPAGRAAAVHRARRAADPRRDPERHGPHRRALLVHAEGHRARHPDQREGTGRRLSDRRDAHDRPRSRACSRSACTARPTAAIRSPARSRARCSTSSTPPRCSTA